MYKLGVFPTIAYVLSGKNPECIMILVAGVENWSQAVRRLKILVSGHEALIFSEFSNLPQSA